MAEAVERVPAENRWAIATQALTGAVMAGNKALLDVAGRETYNGIVGQFWSEAGKGSKQIADALGLPGDSAESAAATAQMVSVLTMGPEVRIETVDATPDRAVVRLTECALFNRTKEMGISDDLCTTACPAFLNGLTKAFNPELTVTLLNAMPLGDAHCEWAWDRQK